MSIEVNIGDGKGTGRQAHLHKENGFTGVIAFTDPLRTFESILRPFTNDSFGIQLNQNGEFSGTPEGVHNGIDTVYWTASNISGTKVTFDSLNRPRSGVKSIYADRMNTSDVFQIDKGSDIDLSNYTAIRLYLNVDSDWGAGDSVSMYGWDTAGGTQVGDSILLEDYFNFFDFDVWNSLTIPLTDMNLEAETIDAFRIEVVSSSGTKPRWYIDDFQIEETGTPIDFTAEPRQGYRFTATGIRVSIVDTITLTNLSWDKFFSLTKLSNGIQYQRQTLGDIRVSFNVRCLEDLLWVGFDVSNQETDGADSIMTFDFSFTQPFTLDSRAGDFVALTINDDLSSLLSFRAILFGREELLT